MIWLTWRQFRAQTLVAAARWRCSRSTSSIWATRCRDFYDTRIVGCAAAGVLASPTGHFRDEYRDAIIAASALLLIAVPGADRDLLGRAAGRPGAGGAHRPAGVEPERHPHPVAGGQARPCVGLISAAVTGLFSLLLTWSASRYDQVIGERFAALSFDSRNIVPIGYALFAFVLGTVVGMLVRRTLPAMAITLAVFAALQFADADGGAAAPDAAGHRRPSPSTPPSSHSGVGLNLKEDNDASTSTATPSPAAGRYTSASQLFKADGSPYIERGRDAVPGRRETGRRARRAPSRRTCTSTYTYHPGNRYWPFQWIELSLFVVTLALLTGFGFFWLRRRS